MVLTQKEKNTGNKETGTNQQQQSVTVVAGAGDVLHRK